MSNYKAGVSGWVIEVCVKATVLVAGLVLILVLALVFLLAPVLAVDVARSACGNLGEGLVELVEGWTMRLDGQRSRDRSDSAGLCPVRAH